MINIKNSSTIYISQEFGNDDYAGFLPHPDGKGNGPLKTITQLQKRIYAMRGSGNERPITVRFMGDYCLDKSIEIGAKFGSSRNGKNYTVADITFESYKELPARIIGGKILKGFKEDTFNGVKCISLHIPEVKSGKWKFTDLYVNGAPASRTRYPKCGTFEAVTTEFPRNNGDVYDCLYKGSKWFIAHKEDLKDIEDIENAIVSFYHFWIDEHSPIESYDAETGRIDLAYRTRFNITTQYDQDITSDLHYYLENVPNAFGAAGEWYLDVKGGNLYYIPKEGETLENLEIIAPTVKHFANICGDKDNKAAGIRFRNLEFIATKGEYESHAEYEPRNGFTEECFASDVQSCRDAHGSFAFENAEDCRIENCKISCTGTYAVNIYKGCSNIVIEGCDIFNCGAGGVKIWGTAAEGEEDVRPTGYCRVTKNSIKNCGKRYAAGCGIIIVHSAHNEISYNEISDLEYSGISVGWEWGYMESSTYGNVIRKNHVHHIGKGNLSDMGGIYLLGKQHGTVVEGNLVHDITSKHYGAMGIYTDQGTSYVTIENNIVYNCKSCCYQHHYGKANTLRDNIFAFGGEALVCLSLCENNMSTQSEDNVFITDGKPIFTSINERIPTDLCASNNIYWDISGNSPVMQKSCVGDILFEEWQNKYGFDTESKIQKPSDEILKAVGIIPTED